MSGKSTKHFTIGEFAQLFGISKQTLFYYERAHIFIPAVIDDNGYRYYSLEQYFLFEIIITLRKLDIPLKIIRGYLADRSAENLQKLLEDKIFDFSLAIELLQRNKEALENRVHLLQDLPALTEPFLSLAQQETEYLLIDRFSAGDTPAKELVRLIARHNLPLATSEIFNEYALGYILPREHFLKKNYRAVDKVFTRVPSLEEYPEALGKTAGLYASVVAADATAEHYLSVSQQLAEFIQKNNLTICSDIFIEYLQNYWTAADRKNYVVKISVQVK